MPDKTKNEKKSYEINDIILFTASVLCFLLSVIVYGNIYFQSSKVKVNERKISSSTGFIDPAATKSPEPTGKININTAGIEELAALPGIGEKKALEIIKYRSIHSFFKKPGDIIKVSGIGEKTFQRIKDMIVTE